MRMVTLLGALVSVSLIIGCGSKRSLSEYQCSAGDWYTVGEMDGRNGYGQARLLVHQDACGPQGIVPDSDAYRSGWASGVAQYCEPSRGYQQGVSGRALPTVCPAEYRAAYKEAYDQGRVLYVAIRDVKKLENAIAHAEQRIDHINSEVIQLATAQIASGLSPQERVRLATRAQELMSEKQRLQRDLPGLRGELEAARAHLAAVEASTPRLARVQTI